MATKKTKKKKVKTKARGKKFAPKKKTSKKKAAPRKKSSGRKSTAKKIQIRGKSEIIDSVVYEPKGLGARSAGQSGDLQGLSGIAGAASESVEELLEEGNAFEAEVVRGVQKADSADEREVTTHEVPEDDVPEEYLDEK
jgi:hypothetical protein